MQFPDYTRCGVNVAASILKYFDVKTGHPSLDELDAVLAQKKYRNIVLMLFDGLSIDALDRHLSPDSFLRQRVSTTLSAVFPSTTTAATTSIITGLEPGEHGWIGWTLHFEALRKSIDIFTNRVQFTGELASKESVVKEQLPYIPVTDLITGSGKGTGRCVSPFDDIIIGSIDDLFIQTKKLMAQKGRHYIYAYWPEPDHLMHAYGCRDERVKQAITDINARLQTFCHHLGPDDLLLVTADHGLVDGIPDCLEDHPELEAMLRIPPSVEPRAAALYIKDKYKSAFPKAFLQAFGDHYILMDQEEAIKSNLFGKSPVRAQLPSLIGDYFAVSTGPYALFQKRRHCRIVGMHAGLTPAEMNVPLVILQAK